MRVLCWVLVARLVLTDTGVDTQAAELRPTVSAVPEYNALFHRERGWTGADVCSSVALSEDTTLWLYGDTWVGDIREGKHAAATMVNNSVALQRGKDPAKASVEFFYGRGQDGKPAALIVPADGRGFFWLQSGVQTRKGLFLLAAQVEKAGRADDAFGFRQVAVWLIQVANPEQPPTQWRTAQQKIPWSQFPPQGNKCFGCALLKHEGFVYAYGCDEDIARGFHRKHAIVARVAEADLADFDRWRFFAAGGWQADLAKAERLFGGAANEYSVSYQPALQKFIAVCTPDGMSAQIQVRLADSPQGPWGQPTTVYRCPEAQWHKSIFCYAAKGHPTLSMAADELIVTYVANSTDFRYAAGHAEIYWPRFLRLRFQPAQTDGTVAPGSRIGDRLGGGVRGNR